MTLRMGREFQARSGKDGLFRLAGLRASTTVDIEVSAGEFPVLRQPSVFLPEDGPVDLGDVELGTPVPLEVLVVDAQGVPVSGVRVTVHRDCYVSRGHEDAYHLHAFERTPAEADVVTDRDGRAVGPPLPPGWVVVEVTREGCARVVEPRYLREGELPDIVRVVLEPEVVFEGSLRARDGTPVPGAQVSVEWREYPVNALGFLSVPAVTGADGAFRIPGLRAGMHFLKVRTSPDRLYTSREIAAGRGGPLDVTLPGGQELVVKVVADEDGAPIPLAPIHLQVHQETVPNMTCWFRGETDDRGVAEFRDLPAGKIYSLRPQVPGREPAPVLTSRSRRWDLVPGIPRSVEVRMREGIRVVGQVRGVGGVPFGGARVRLVAWDEETDDGRPFPPVRCDAAGEFQIQGVPPGPVVVAVEPPLAGSTIVEGDYWTYGRGSKRPNVTEIRLEPAPVVELHLGIQNRGSVSGSVRDASGKPAAGVLVNVYPSGGSRRGALGRAAATSPDGTFRVTAVENPEGPVYVWCWGSGGRQGTSSAFALDGRGSAEGVTVRLVAGSGVAGKVVTAEGASVPGARISLFSGAIKAREEGWMWNQFNSAPLAVPVGADGTFRRDGLRGGAWTPLVTGPGLEPTLCDPIELKAGQVLEGVVLVPTRSAVLKGTVLDSKNRPVSGARVLIERVAGEGRHSMPERLSGETPVRTDSEGRFLHVGGPEGRYALTASAPGLQEATVPVETGKGEARIVLKPALAIAGRVLDAETGEPIPGLEIEEGFHFKIGPIPAARLTDSRGAFRIEGLAPGTTTLSMGKGSDGREDYAPFEQEDVPAGTEDLVFRLHRGKTISGTVVDPAGRPLADRVVTVELERPGMEAPPGEPTFLSRWVSTDSAGTFRAEGLLDGSYTVNLQFIPNRENAPRPFPIRRKGVAAGTGNLKLVETLGVQLDFLVADENGKPVPLPDAGGGAEESSLLAWVRRASAPGTAAPDAQEEDTELGSAVGPSWKFWQRAFPQAGGTLRFAPAVAGAEYELLARIEKDGRWGRARCVAGKESVPRVVLRAGSAIEGQVLDTEGNTVPSGVSVEARSLDSLPPELAGGGAETDDEGRFRIEGLVEGPHMVRAGGGTSDFLMGSAKGPVPTGARSVRIVLNRGLVISGKIIDHSDKPGRAVSITAYAEGTQSGARVKKDGSFRLGGLPAGKVSLQVWVSGNDERGVPFTYTIDQLPAEAPAEGIEVDITEMKGRD